MNANLQTTAEKPIEPIQGFYSVGLHAALNQLEVWEIGAHQLSRVSVDSDGTLQLEAERADSREWFYYTGGKLRRANPRHDIKIPGSSGKFVGKKQPIGD